MRIYLDCCCCSRPYDGQGQLRVREETSAKVFIQILVKRRVVRLFTSYVLLEEVSAEKDEEKKANIMDFILENHSGYIAKDKESALKASVAEIASTGIAFKDAVHIACAILARCDYFISTDKRLLKFQSDKIKLVNPVDFQKIWEGADND